MQEEVAWNKIVEMGQARRGVVDEPCCEWMTFEVRKETTQLLSNLEPNACASEGQKCATLTTLGQMRVRRGILS